MSETATQIDAGASLASWVRQVSGMYCKDIRALSEEAYTQSAGGVARTAQDFTNEVAGFNRYLAKLLVGETPSERTDEEKAAALEACGTIAGGCEAISTSGEALAAGLEAAGPRLSESTMAPWGAPITLYEFALIAANHIMYHDGQVTFLQSLKGDGEMHWFDE